MGKYDSALRLGRLLKRLGMTVATAESCTAGGIGNAIASVAGSSQYFRGGAIVYSAAAKEKVLGVRHATIADMGVVSAETVREMAAGAASLFMTDCAVSVSGVAGPGKGDDDASVGTVWIGIYIRGVSKEKCISHDFGSRNENMENAILAAIDFLCEELELFSAEKDA